MSYHGAGLGVSGSVTCSFEITSSGYNTVCRDSAGNVVAPPSTSPPPRQPPPPPPPVCAAGQNAWWKWDHLSPMGSPVYYLACADRCPQDTMETARGVCSPKVLFGQQSPFVASRSYVEFSKVPSKTCLDADARNRVTDCLRGAGADCDAVYAQYASLPLCDPSVLALPTCGDAELARRIDYCAASHGAQGPDPNLNAVCWLWGRVPGYIAALWNLPACPGASFEPGTGAAEEKKDNTALYIGIGLLGLGIYIMLKNR